MTKKPESVLAPLLNAWAENNREHRQAIAERTTKYLGLDQWSARLVDVPTEYGGGWLVLTDGPCRGPSGYIAHIDRSGWILRVEPYTGWNFPDLYTPIEKVMARLIDDPVLPGMGLITPEEENCDE